MFVLLVHLRFRNCSNVIFLRSGLICKETYCLLRLPEMVSVRILPTLEGFTEFKVVRSSVMLITTDYWTDESKAFCTK